MRWLALSLYLAAFGAGLCFGLADSSKGIVRTELLLGGFACLVISHVMLGLLYRWELRGW